MTDFKPIKEILSNIVSDVDSNILIDTKYLKTLEHIFDEDYYTHIDRNTSLVFKQLKKFPKEEQEQWERWIKEYYTYIHIFIISISYFLLKKNLIG